MKKTIAVLYGGRSPEHEVSIITALQAMHALTDAGHTVMPIYISKDGQWFNGDTRFLQPGFYQNLNHPAAIGKKQAIIPSNKQNPMASKGRFSQWSANEPIDAVFPIFHGANGEDGSIQGLFQILNVPVIGSAVTHTAVGVDKYLSKRIAGSLGIPTVPDVLVTSDTYKQKLTEIKQLGNDVIVKPNRLGSSIGVGIAHNQQELEQALEAALSYDSRVLVEQLMPDPTEINVAIMGNDPYEFSATEQPIKHDALLSFEDKYMRGGGKKTGTKTTGAKGMASSDRLIPAPVDNNTESRIKSYAEMFFRAVNGRGMARIDFMKVGETVYFNEINTIPGSLAFYLWDKVGKSFPELMDQMVDLGLAAHKQEQKLIHSFDSNLLAAMTL